jgi:hypothetical protein
MKKNCLPALQMAAKTTGLMTFWIGFFDWLYMLIAPLAYDSKYGYSTENFCNYFSLSDQSPIEVEVKTVC